MRRFLSLAMAACATTAHAQAPLSLHSPDGRVVVNVGLGSDGALAYDVGYSGKPVIASSPVGLVLTGGGPGDAGAGRLMNGLRILATDRREGHDAYTPIHGKTSRVDDAYSEITVHAQETTGRMRKVDLVLRAYDAGAAFRMIIPPQEGLARVRVANETTRFAFPENYNCLGLNLGQYYNSHEGEFDPIQARFIRPHHLFDTPLVCRTANLTFALAESDLENYAGAYFSGRGDGGLGVDINLTPWPNTYGVAVDAAVPANGFRTPWRVVMIADRPEKLIESNLIDDLAAPSRIADTSWIKPGKAAWDWWSGPLAPNAGHDNATYKLFIDFAARFGLPYMLIDEGWAKGAGGGGAVRPDSDVTQTAPGVDMPGLVAYAAKKKVGLWLWLNWKALDKQMADALPLYEKWGIKGIKVDFMDREDQAMVDFYHKLLSAAAAHHLMVDLHGAYAPRGLERTYPNFVTQEGVMGAEYNKWSRRETATHNVSLAYSRGLLGPMDYTPGGFRNVAPAQFEPRDVGPEVMTTRAQQLAMYVVYQSAFASLADAPSAYETPDFKPVPGADFLKIVPTSWDETRAIAGEFGHYVVVARRKGNQWFVGAINDETARGVAIPLDFLGPGKWTADTWIDGATPSDVRTGHQPLTARTMMLNLASGGGAALVFTAR